MAHKILLVEDDKEFRELYHKQLEEAGFEVEICDTAGQAMDELKNKTFDIVVLDVMLPPSTDGLSLLRSIKSDKKNQNLPVLMLTNVEDTKLIKEAMDAGAVGYIAKIATTPSDFLIQIKTFLPEESSTHN